MKETFIIRTEWYDAIQELTECEKAIIFDNLFKYHMQNNADINTSSLPLKIVWKLIEPNLARNINSYDKRKDTSSENGKKGGRPPKPNKPKKITYKPTESLSVSVSDSVSVLVSDSVNKKYFILKGVPVKDLSVFEYCMKNFQMLIESHIISFGNGNVTMQRLAEYFERNYPSGSVFSDDRHLQNLLKERIKFLGQTKAVIKTEFKQTIPDSENTW